MSIKERIKEYFGKGKTEIKWNNAPGVEWDWENFHSTKEFPVSDKLLDWVIGQDQAMKECYLCLDEWVHKIKNLDKDNWWKDWEKPENAKPTVKKKLSPGPYLFLLGDPGTGKSLIGRALADKLTDLYKEHNVKLYDVLSWKNKIIPGEPKVSIHLSPKGKEIILQERKKVDKNAWKKSLGINSIKWACIGLGLLLLFVASYVLFKPWIANDLVNSIPVQILYEGNFPNYFINWFIANSSLVVPLLTGGGMLLFSSIFIGYLSKMFGSTGGMKGISGSENTNAPKILIDNSQGIAQFIDATGHGSSQLFGSIAWDPYQTGGLGTPEHQRVSAGDVHRANLGILYIDELKNLLPAEAITLLTVLEDGQLPIALRSQFHGGDSIAGDAMSFFKENGNIRYCQFKELIKSFEGDNKIEVLCPEYMDFKCRKLVWTPVLRVFRRGKKPIKNIELIGGKSIRLTKDHSLFRYNNSHNQQPLVPSTIEYGKCIVINRFEIPKVDIESESENNLEFYGYWIGDGHFEADKVIGLATGKSEKDRSFVFAYARKLGITASLKNKKGDIRIYSTDLVKKMKSLGFVSGSFFKTIPEWIFFLPENKVKAFIRGYLRSDGSRYRKDRRMITQFGSVNRKLLEDFQSLFSIIGVEASLSSGKLNEKTAYKSPNLQYQLTIWKDSSEDFEVNHLRNQGLLTLHRIKKITDEGEVEVFDISTKQECFIANGILCHNTSAMAVSTEPLPCVNFLVGAGNFDSIPQIHPALMDRIYGYGKVVRMNNDFPNTKENRRKYVQFIAQEISRFNLMPFTRDACIEVIEEARRRSGKRDALTTKFRPLISILKTASVLAMNEGKEEVEAKHVKTAISEHCKTIQKQLLEHMIEEEDKYLVIEPKGKKSGIVYGLAVSEDEYSGEMIGSVMRLKAQMIPVKQKQKGSFAVTGISKDALYMPGSIAKVRSVILKKYGQDIANEFNTHIDFSQSYSVDGPSAGVTMTLALCSLLEKKKIRQDVAITGEINISSENEIEITAVGGLYEKIKAAERWGFKEVIIPEKNYLHSIDPSDFKIKVVPGRTLDDYLKILLL